MMSKWCRRVIVFACLVVPMWCEREQTLEHLQAEIHMHANDGKLCVVEEKDEAVKYGLSFSYDTMPRYKKGCGIANCQPIKLMSTEKLSSEAGPLIEDLITALPDSKYCACKIKTEARQAGFADKKLLQFEMRQKGGEDKACNPKECWQTYSDLRRTTLGMKENKGASSGQLLASQDHWRASCKGESEVEVGSWGKTTVPNIKEIAAQNPQDKDTLIPYLDTTDLKNLEADEGEVEEDEGDEEEGDAEAVAGSDASGEALPDTEGTEQLQEGDEEDTESEGTDADPNEEAEFQVNDRVIVQNYKPTWNGKPGKVTEVDEEDGIYVLPDGERDHQLLLLPTQLKHAALSDTQEAVNLEEGDEEPSTGADGNDGEEDEDLGDGEAGDSGEEESATETSGEAEPDEKAVKRPWASQPIQPNDDNKMNVAYFWISKEFKPSGTALQYAVPKEEVYSIRQAASFLTTGDAKIANHKCYEKGVCVVWSKSSSKWYVLYQKEKVPTTQAARDVLGLSEEVPLHDGVDAASDSALCAQIGSITKKHCAMPDFNKMCPQACKAPPDAAPQSKSPEREGCQAKSDKADVLSDKTTTAAWKKCCEDSCGLNTDSMKPQIQERKCFYQCIII